MNSNPNPDARLGDLRRGDLDVVWLILEGIERLLRVEVGVRTMLKSSEWDQRVPTLVDAALLEGEFEAALKSLEMASFDEKLIGFVAARTWKISADNGGELDLINVDRGRVPRLSDEKILSRRSVISKITLVFMTMLVFQGRIEEADAVLDKTNAHLPIIDEQELDAFHRGDIATLTAARLLGSYRHDTQHDRFGYPNDADRTFHRLLSAA